MGVVRMGAILQKWSGKASEELTSQQRSKRTVFQAEGTAWAKAVSPEFAQCVSETARKPVSLEQRGWAEGKMVGDGSERRLGGATTYEQFSTRSSGRALTIRPTQSVKCLLSAPRPWPSLHVLAGLKGRAQSSNSCKRWWDFHIILFFPLQK